MSIGSCEAILTRAEPMLGAKRAGPGGLTPL